MSEPKPTAQPTGPEHGFIHSDSTDIMLWFATEARARPQLSDEALQALLPMVNPSTDATLARSEVMRRITEGTARLLLHVARSQPTTPSYGRSDAVNEGYFGLAQAARQYRPGHEAKFSTFALRYIHGAARRGRYNQGYLIHVPRERTIAAFAIHARVDEADMPDDVREDYLLLMPAYGQAPLQPDDDKTLFDILPSPEDTEATAVRNLQWEAVKEHLHQLSPEERQVLGLRFGLDGAKEHSYQEIGDVLGLTLGAARHLTNKALKHIRELVDVLDDIT